ncbi:hypothetical protein [Prevotella dentasini]|uniref:hypothetical protein n=1 Tax=Prevotella dentasini TaxID=589537 RepID=UPI00046885F2|nr:hypothetical protein [Prevotella dentasini]
MRFNVRCNSCGRTFIAETEAYGKQKYRCPYCGVVLNCQFDEPEEFRTKARSVIPLVDVTPVVGNKVAELPTVKPKILRMPSAEKLQELRQKIAHTSFQAGETVKEVTANTSEYIARGSSRLARFQEKYADGNLWIFFGGSLLFILLVFVGLFVCAEVVKLLAEGHSWLFKNYIELRNNL